MDPQRLETLLAAMTRVGAAALHLVPGRAPLLRVQRRFVPGDEAPVTAADVDEMTRDMLFSDHRRRLAAVGHVEVLYVARSGRRYRAVVASAGVQAPSGAATGGQTTLALRPLPEEPPRFADADLPEQLAGFTRFRHGFVVVAGAFGSGKSTTMAALVDACSADPARHVATIEHTIQFVHQDGAALLHQREVGTHVATAALGIHQAMAVGVGVLFVDEIRDVETFDAALCAAESGCLVFGAVEAGSVIGALSHLLELAPVEQRARLRVRLARSLRGASAQGLLNRSHRPGRVPVVELLVASPQVRASVRTGRLQDLPAIMHRCRGLGMQTMDQALRALLQSHQVAQEEALLHAVRRDVVEVHARPR